ncbi:MAG: glucose-6-phosphate isomerase [Candidatus Methanosuratus sp.]|nr:glucose-6-phosphate isomerase [Candidatus Methanosuratincola sp.]
MLLQVINYPFGKLELGADLSLRLNGTPLKGEPRLLRDLKPVLRNPGFVTDKNSGKVLYMMYRSVVVDPMHTEIFRMHSVRFDLTVMDYCLLDREPNKTLGHVHPEAMPGLSYPELYQVLHGRAIYLLQRLQGSSGRVSDFLVVEAGPGDAVLIPPNYGHVTVNVGGCPLVMANLVSTRFSSNYGPYKELRGASYYLLENGVLEPNPNYPAPPEPIRSDVKYPVSKDIYTDFICCPKSYSFLNDPTRIGVRYCKGQ